MATVGWDHIGPERHRAASSGHPTTQNTHHRTPGGFPHWLHWLITCLWATKLLNIVLCILMQTCLCLFFSLTVVLSQLTLNIAYSLLVFVVLRCLWRRWPGNSQMSTKLQRPTKENQPRLRAAWLREEELVSHLCLPLSEQILPSPTLFDDSLSACGRNIQIPHLGQRGFVNSLLHLQANSSSSSSSRQPCRSLEETHDSTSSVPGGSRCGCWLLTASANSMMVWTGWRRYLSCQLNVIRPRFRNIYM